MAINMLLEATQTQVYDGVWADSSPVDAELPGSPPALGFLSAAQAPGASCIVSCFLDTHLTEQMN